MAKEIIVRAGKEVLTKIGGALGVVAGLVSVAEFIPGAEQLIDVVLIYIIVRSFNIVEKKLFGTSETEGSSSAYPARTDKGTE